jgi:hypothetical protein
MSSRSGFQQEVVKKAGRPTHRLIIEALEAKTLVPAPKKEFPN